MPSHRRLDELTRNRTAGDLVFEDKAFARCRFDLEFDVAKLTAAARLFLEYLFARCTDRDRFAVCNLRFTDVRFDAELALHAIDDDLKVKLAHSGDDRLARFVIGRNLERRIFLSKTIERDAHFVLVGTRFRFDRNTHDRIREIPSIRE